ncbi:DUF397 domain-containing protein [Umezawaea sp. Da 62-37]|uniref:DUF397 domain-containing protein n=1 Tax=Umezawaea sp. Da 62-37 TaxID=3075927 RepID=UPI0028F6DCFE|nr:DUF397 domain-containing protein [Umezawaea sp. Da 62-37]WNV89032.1 DUF397 domain-containing protein [Umezawaea sp. Da 62-37]
MTPDLSSARWRTSSYSNGSNGNCVQVAHVGEVMAVRDSKNPAGPVLLLRQSGLTAFLDAVKVDQFDG